MKRHTERPYAADLIYTASASACPDCGGPLSIYQVLARAVERLDDRVRVVRRDKRCGPACPGARPLFYAPRDLRVMLPGRIYGLDVAVHVGERHLRDGVALAQITRDLNARGLPLDQRHTGRVFRDFLALTALARGDERAVQDRLRAQGGIVLMCDGVQFENRSPVLYLAWDAISGTPLFGERKPFRSEDDLVPLLRRVAAMGVPVRGIVTDKEKGLVPAVEAVFPGAPYPFCQTHFLMNCAKPLQPDRAALQASVQRRAEAVRKVARRLSPAPMPMPTSAPAPASTPAPTATPTSTPTPLPASPPASPEGSAPPGLTEEDLAREVCDLVRANSRVSGKAPLAPPELERHDRLEKIRALVNDARGKKVRRPTASPRPGSTTSPRPSSRTGTTPAPPGASPATPTSCAGSRTNSRPPLTAPTGRPTRPRRKRSSRPT